MECGVVGGSLRDRIHGQGKPRMTVVETLKIAMELAQALTFLHPEIVHRDLKPENIMLSENAQARIIGGASSLTPPCDFDKLIP